MEIVPAIINVRGRSIYDCDKDTEGERHIYAHTLRMKSPICAQMQLHRKLHIYAHTSTRKGTHSHVRICKYTERKNTYAHTSTQKQTIIRTYN